MHASLWHEDEHALHQAHAHAHLLLLSAMQVRKLVASAQLDIPGHAWLAPPKWLRLCDALQLLALRASALECILEGAGCLAGHVGHVSVEFHVIGSAGMYYISGWLLPLDEIEESSMHCCSPQAVCLPAAQA